jgi:hypothetical protein
MQRLTVHIFDSFEEGEAFSPFPLSGDVGFQVQYMSHDGVEPWEADTYDFMACAPVRSEILDEIQQLVNDILRSAVAKPYGVQESLPF